jgi:hypothetical protein
MDVAAEFLQPFLLLDAEALLFVDHDETEFLEGDRLAEQRVGADDDVHPPLGQALPGLVRLLGADQPGQLLDADREALEAAAEGLVMLAHQQRGRSDDRHLIPGHCDQESGA